MTGALLKGLTIVEYKSCGVSKAHEIVLKRPLTQSIVLFHKIYLNLLLGIVAYNSDRHIAHFLDNVTQINNINTMA